MPDFRTSKYPSEMAANAIAQSTGQNSGATMVNSALNSFSKGMELVEGIEKYKEKKKEAKRIADLLINLNKDPEVDNFVKTQGVPKALVLEAALKDPDNVMKTIVDSNKGEKKQNYHYVDTKGQIWIEDPVTNKLVIGTPKAGSISKTKPAESPFVGKQDQRLQANLIERFNGDVVVKGQRSALSSAKDIQALIASGTPIEANAIPTYMARLSGEVGNLSEADKKPFGTSKQINDRLKQIGQYLVKGTMTEENKQFILQFAKTVEQRKTAQIALEAKRRAKQYAKISGNPYGSEKQIEEMLTAGEMTDVKTPEEMADIENQDLINQLKALREE